MSNVQLCCFKSHNPESGTVRRKRKGVGGWVSGREVVGGLERIQVCEFPRLQEQYHLLQ